MVGTPLKAETKDKYHSPSLSDFYFPVSAMILDVIGTIHTLFIIIILVNRRGIG
jgi:hypothetical protein